MKIAVAQINTTVGDFAGNAKLLVDCIEVAREEGATLFVAPELALSGYPPEDLLYREDFSKQAQAALEQVATVAQGITVIVGYPRLENGARYNAAALCRGGKVVDIYDKQKLPNYRVFDEKRYFEAGHVPLVFEHEGRRVSVTICEDLWFPEPAAQAKAAGAELLLSLNASPYHLNKLNERYQVARDRARETGLPVLYVHCVGGQDELVFDGASFAVDASGNVTYQSASFQQRIDIVEFDGKTVDGGVEPEELLEATVYKALVTGVRDYVNKNGFPGVLLGLSGGIDSALVLALVVDALGKDRVHAVMMPSDYTASISVEDAREMVKILGVKYSEIAIKPMFEAFKASLAENFKGRAEDTTEENLQSRIRGTLLMAMSNKFGDIVITTGNKSEMATGYATLYGDMAGGFALLKDISKMLVYRLSNYRNTLGRVIPQRVIDRPPSAELRPDQKDQDSLPPYDVLDAIIERFMEQDQSPETIIAAGFDAATVRKVVRLIQVNEYKRRQAPVGVRITPRGFGKDWRYPITSKYKPQ
ncbi:MAG: NAD+ synthase [Burkholderiales bacterium]|nr:NAD+ synthase [Burkholderiales bacterium]